MRILSRYRCVFAILDDDFHDDFHDFHDDFDDFHDDFDDFHAFDDDFHDDFRDFHDVPGFPGTC